MYEKLKVVLRNTQNNNTKDLFFNIREHHVAQNWATALITDYINTDAILEKQFMMHGWIFDENNPNARTVDFMCRELNFHINRINDYCQRKKINYFINMSFDSNTVDQEQLNEIHHHFEILIGQIWNVSSYYNMFDQDHQFSVNNLNWLCHEIESKLRGIYAFNEKRSSSSIVVCMKPIVRYDLIESNGDYDYFEMKDLEFGQVRMHYAQTGKTHWEAYYDSDEDIYDSNISGIRYLSGEFDINLKNKIKSDQELLLQWEDFKDWITQKGLDVNDKTLSLGFAVLADMDKTGMPESEFEIMQELWKYDDILSIGVLDTQGNIFEKSWEYTWQDWYNQRKTSLINNSTKI